MCDICEEFKRLFREADFQHLIKIGAPLDEYDHEALYLFHQIVPSDSVFDIQNKIWNHFYDSFCTGTSFSKNGNEKEWKANEKRAKKMIGTLDTYLEIAQKIKKLIGD